MNITAIFKYDIFYDIRKEGFNNTIKGYWYTKVDDTFYIQEYKITPIVQKMYF